MRAVTISHAAGWGHLRTTIEKLVALTKPGGQILLGEGYWRIEPSDEYLAALGGASRDEMESYGGTLAVVESGFVNRRADEILDGIDPEERAVGAAPREGPDGQWFLRFRGVRQHAEAKPEAIAVAPDVDAAAGIAKGSRVRHRACHSDGCCPFLLAGSDVRPSQAFIR